MTDCSRPFVPALATRAPTRVHCLQPAAWLPQLPGRGVGYRFPVVVQPCSGTTKPTKAATARELRRDEFPLLRMSWRASVASIDPAVVGRWQEGDPRLALRAPPPPPDPRRGKGLEGPARLHQRALEVVPGDRRGVGSERRRRRLQVAVGPASCSARSRGASRGRPPGPRPRAVAYSSRRAQELGRSGGECRRDAAVRAGSAR